MLMGFDGYLVKRRVLRRSLLVSLFVGHEKVRTLNTITLDRCAGRGNSPRKAKRKVRRPLLYRPFGKSEERAACSSGFWQMRALSVSSRYDFNHSRKSSSWHTSSGESLISLSGELIAR